jgi:hypothetical protein
LLFATVTNRQGKVDELTSWAKNPEFQWYLSMLNAYVPSIRPYLNAEISEKEDKDEQTIFMTRSLELLKQLGDTLAKTGQTPCLNAIRHELYRNTILESASSEQSANTVIFSMIGWLSMIYEPGAGVDEQQNPALTIQATDFKGDLLQTGIYQQRSANLNEHETTLLPLQNILATFGKLIPGHLPSAAVAFPNIQNDVFQEQLVVSYLNFQTLSEVAGIRISWVNCISLHLDFDEKSRRLKVFRFPSFCKLMCTNAGKESPADSSQTPRFLSS